MDVRSLLDDYSLEITVKDVQVLATFREHITPGTPISITFLPGNVIEELVATASAVRRLGFEPVPHISARRLSSARDLERLVAGLREDAQVERTFVIGGDPDQPHGPFDSALSVIETGTLARNGIRQVGIAGYPEGHPGIAVDLLEGALSAKLELIERQGLSAEIVTQFVFDSDAVMRWLRDLRSRGIDAPARIGIPGPASVKSLIRFAARCGVGASAKVLAKYGISIGRLLSTASPDRLMCALASQLDPARHGTVKTHLYPFGGIAQTTDWLSRLSDHASSATLEPTQ